jgi:valyl-tRNA synthetase
MTRALPKEYSPFEAEPRWQRYWEDKGFYTPKADDPGEAFSMVLPPPNVTGSLHMGHGLCFTLPDVVMRYRKMKGFKTLWVPGTDHASIAVHTVLDKQFKEEGTDRFKLGRPAFMERAWAWKEKSRGQITGQLRSLGLSLDWSRECFTLDTQRDKAVVKVFVDLHSKGLIYRGKYLVNWCTASQTAVSDLEVDEKEVKGSLWHFAYPVVDSEETLVVATTRPETMLGDTAVAVHPQDPRYQHLIGKWVRLPIVDREIPIIGDEAVEMDFGSGAVKVTPAHDQNDFEIGQRHNLPMINLLNPNGTYNENAGPYAGLDRFKVRTAVEKQAEAEGWLLKKEDYKHNVPYSERGGVPVEPYLSDQWFLDVRPMAERCLKDFDENHTPVFVPERWGNVYRDWLVRIRPWCISRQLWWGHQIPAWYVVDQEVAPIVAHNEDAANAQAVALYGEGVQLRREDDVLDTWFSSALWPFSTLGWPEETADFNTFFPNALMSTGFDIIFFWVARMSMMAKAFTDEIPFKTVYINGIVRDDKSQKMSKSKGNGIDPIELMDIYGTDALRYTLVREVTGAGQDVRLDWDKKKKESRAVDASKRFANKIWNASRFVLMNLDDLTPEQLGAPESEKLELADRWILSRLDATSKNLNTLLDRYALGEGAKAIYEFIWDDFCDWYVELAKPRLDNPETRRSAQQVLAFVLDRILRLLHPWMPHITEEIWQLLNQPTTETSILLQPYPVGVTTPIAEEPDFSLIQEVVRTIRNLRQFVQIPPLQKIALAILETANPNEQAALERTRSYISYLAKVEELELRNGEAAPLTQVAFGVTGTVQVFLPLGGLVDIEALKVKLEKALEKLDKESAALNGRLSNESYVQNAPPELVKETRDKLSEIDTQTVLLKEQLTRLG